MPLYEEALRITRRLNEGGQLGGDRFHLMVGLNNLGSVFYELGELDKARTYFEEALAVHQRDTSRQLATAPEAELQWAARWLPQLRDRILSITGQTPGQEEAAYRVVWATRFATTQVLEKRHAAARALAAGAGAKVERLRAIRRRVEQIVGDARLKQ